MGHEVLDHPVDAGAQKLSRKQFPTAEELNACDLILVSGPEHINRFLTALYDWPAIRTKKAAWLHETVEREDYGQLDVENLKAMADVVFAPAVQDVKHGFEYLAFGVDTEVFKPELPVGGGQLPEKKYEAGFIGLVYPKRQEFLRKLEPHLGDVRLHVGSVQVIDLGGVNAEASRALYVEEIRRTRVFVNLPTLSQLMVTKIWEVLACGTLLLTPKLKGEAAANMEPLKDREHLVYYDANDTAVLAKTMQEFARGGGEPIALAGCKTVHAEHSLRARLGTLLTRMEIEVPAGDEVLA